MSIPLDNYVYLDNAATSFPKPESVYAAMDNFARSSLGNPGRATHKFARHSDNLIENLRVKFANFFDVKTAERIIFTLNCTDALNIGLKGIIPLLPNGSEVITSFLEHNSVNRVLARFEAQGKIKVNRAPSNLQGIIDPKTIESLITENTKMIVINHASNVLGVIQDIKSIGKIARARGILFVVDAAQTAGAVQVSIEDCHIDILASSGHKSLLGPSGTGVLFYGENCPGGKEGLVGLREGGSGSDSTLVLHPEIFPYSLEAGTANVGGLAGLDAGLNYITKKTIKAIRSHELELVDYALKELSVLDCINVFGPRRNNIDRKVGVISFQHDNFTSHELCSIMDENFNIALRAGLHCAPICHKYFSTFPDGLTRLSISPLTTHYEVEYFIKSVIAVS